MLSIFYLFSSPPLKTKTCLWIIIRCGPDRLRVKLSETSWICFYYPWGLSGVHKHTVFFFNKSFSQCSPDRLENSNSSQDGVSSLNSAVKVKKKKKKHSIRRLENPLQAFGQNRILLSTEGLIANEGSQVFPLWEVLSGLLFACCQTPHISLISHVK